MQQPTLADARRLRHGVERDARNALLMRKACGNLQQLLAHLFRLFLAAMSFCHVAIKIPSGRFVKRKPR
ncbi:hypothetical protein D9M70_604040 [compost metagenome]